MIPQIDLVDLPPRTVTRILASSMSFFHQRRFKRDSSNFRGGDAVGVDALTHALHSTFPTSRRELRALETHTRQMVLVIVGEEAWRGTL